MSRYGYWTENQGLPEFVYTADPDVIAAAEWDPIVGPPTRRHFVGLGNRRLQMVVANDGTAGLLDEHDGIRWVTAPDPAGTGISVVTEEDGYAWSSAGHGERRFGPTWFSSATAHEGVQLERTILVPEGEAPYVLVRVILTAAPGRARRVRHTEEWALRPRFVNVGGNAESRRRTALEAVAFEVDAGPGRIVARETRNAAGAGATASLDLSEVLGETSPSESWPQVFGEPVTIALEDLGRLPSEARHDGSPHPVLRLVTEVDLSESQPAELWFRFGLEDSTKPDAPAVFAESMRALEARLPRARAAAAPVAERELRWHAALLTGGACADRVIGGHTLNQASSYSFVAGFNGWARDPLQHALPLVYSEPDLALSVLRNTCAWAFPTGELPHGLDGAKQVWSTMLQPSDLNLWAFWLASEYAAATGDLRAFDAPLAYHPAHGTPAVPLREHLKRQLRYFVDGVGFGSHGHVRIMNADWNDVAIGESGAPRAEMIAEGESVLNSAMASWVLAVYAGLCRRLGESEQAAEADAISSRLRDLVAGEFNGRWFRRAYAPGRNPVGEDSLWLEVQPWAIICGAASDEVARATLRSIDDLCRAGCPLGARVRWPVMKEGSLTGGGEAVNGGTWFSINTTLIWAAARLMPDLAWDEWRRMTLAAHSSAYPEIWEGTLSGPDSYNAPESPRPGRTWGGPETIAFAMQGFPVNNLHSHAQPLLAYLRLLGVEPTSDGELRVGPAVPPGGSFESATFRIAEDGSGSLKALGPVRLDAAGRSIEGGPGTVTW